MTKEKIEQLIDVQVLSFTESGEYGFFCLLVWYEHGISVMLEKEEPYVEYGENYLF